MATKKRRTNEQLISARLLSSYRRFREAGLSPELAFGEAENELPDAIWVDPLTSSVLNRLYGPMLRQEARVAAALGIPA